MRRLIADSLWIVVAIYVIESLPDFARWLKMREM